MFNGRNECIDARAFASLILDYEWPADPYFNTPASVSCRVLIEDLYQTRIHAATREEAIAIFRSGTWKEAI